MSITIHQIQSLLSTYHRQQVQSRLAEARLRLSDDGEETREDKVLISAEAKRLQVYQQTAEEVLKRIRHFTQGQADNGEAAAGTTARAPFDGREGTEPA